MPHCHRPFFATGRQFRVPTALSASLTAEAALGFAQRKAAPADGRPPVLWTIQLDVRSQRAWAHFLESPPMPSGLECSSAADSATTIAGELLFGAYACFCVLRVDWREEATPEAPHTIELLAYPDGEAEPSAEHWPLAPWC